MTENQCGCLCHTKEIEKRIEKLENFIPDVLQDLEKHIVKLDNLLHDLFNDLNAKINISEERFHAMNHGFKKLEEHKQRQIDENRAVSKHFDEIDETIESIDNKVFWALNSIEDEIKQLREKNEKK